MAHKGQIIKDPNTGEWIEFVATAKETNGYYTSFKISQKAGGSKPLMHLHSRQDETFQVLKGELTYIINNEKKKIGEDCVVTLPKGIPHAHFNAGNEDLLMIQTVYPALDFDLVLENFYGLATEGKFPNGEPKFLQLMIWLQQMRSKTYLAKVPVIIQKCVSFILAPFGRMMGYKAVYKKFSGFDA